jgi:hypothetical protein
MILSQRPRYVPAFVRSRARAFTRTTIGATAGTDLGDVYKDENGKLWIYELQAAFPEGEVRARTDQYGGKISPWFERRLGHDHDQVNAWIDLQVGVENAIAAGVAAGTAKKTSVKPVKSGPIAKTSVLAGTPGEPGEPAKASSGTGTAIGIGLLVAALALYLFIG